MKDKLSLEEHEDLGKDLFKIRNTLGSIYILLYRYKNVKKLAGKLFKAHNIIDEVRSDLENQMLSDHKDILPPHPKSAYIYYPGNHTAKEIKEK